MATTTISKTKILGGSFLLEERQTADVFTPEDFTEQHQMIGQTTEEFAVNEILPNAEKIEHKDFSITRDLLKKAGDLALGITLMNPFDREAATVFEFQTCVTVVHAPCYGRSRTTSKRIVNYQRKL